MQSKIEICLLDRQAVELSLSLLQLQVVGLSTSTNRKATMERIASRRFIHWVWRANAKRELYPEYIADLDTGDCLVCR